MKLKFILSALLLIYVGLLHAASNDYSLSRRSEITKNPLNGIGGIKPLRRQNEDVDDDDISMRQGILEAGLGAFGALSSFANAAMGMANTFLGAFTGLLGSMGRGGGGGGGGGPFGMRSYELYGDGTGERVKSIQRLRGILHSPKFRKALKLLDELNFDENDYDASHPHH